MVEDVRNIGEGFDVVDVGRFAEQTALRREGRFAAWIRPPAFQAVDQGGFLAEDVAPGAAVQVDLQPVTAAEDVVAEEAGGFRLRHRPFQVLRALLVGVADSYNFV